MIIYKVNHYLWKIIDSSDVERTDPLGLKYFRLYKEQFSVFEGTISNPTRKDFE